MEGTKFSCYISSFFALAQILHPFSRFSMHLLSGNTYSFYSLTANPRLNFSYLLGWFSSIMDPFNFFPVTLQNTLTTAATAILGKYVKWCHFPFHSHPPLFHVIQSKTQSLHNVLHGKAFSTHEPRPQIHIKFVIFHCSCRGSGFFGHSYVSNFWYIQRNQPVFVEFINKLLLKPIILGKT